MEKIKVNMSPNPLDVQTIHASQNDGEARQWEFELHNNGELIDTSDVKEQMVFKAYKGGTEQLLPENGSTPTTSPFLGDIKYPQGLLSDQEFLYRESPTEEDGNAKITSIKGNTLVWNQLVKPISRTSTSNGITYVYTTDGTMEMSGTAGGTSISYIDMPNIYPSKKVLIKLENDATISNTGCYVRLAKYSGGTNLYSKEVTSCNFTTLKNEIIIDVPSVDTNDDPIDFWNTLQIRIVNGTAITGTLTIKPQLFDLTLMGIDNLTLDEAKQWFADYYPLPYYQYNSGSLLPFKGNGIKTTGKNLLEFDDNWESKTDHGITITNNHDGTITLDGTATATAITIYNFADASLTSSTQNDNQKHLQNGTYKALGLSGGARLQICQSNVTDAEQTTRLNNGDAITITNEYKYNWIRLNITNGSSFSNTVISPMIMFEDVADETFEPYTASTLSLPISTYFPTGMKSAGNAYDELTPIKAIARIRPTDLGSVNWTYNSTNKRFYANIEGVKPSPTNGTAFSINLLTAPYQTIFTDAPVSFWDMLSYIADRDMLIWQYTTGSGVANINIKDTRYTDAATFKTAMSGVYLYFETTTPTETSFTTASLVTENAEIPLSNNDGVLIGKCTEQLSENPGFFDAKIKLADDDGECYSNKIQLHVERSPQ